MFSIRKPEPSHTAELEKRADKLQRQINRTLLRITEAIEYGPPAPPKEPPKNGKHE